MISVGYARTQTKKKIKLFADHQNERKLNQISLKEREEKLAKLSEIFEKE